MNYTDDQLKQALAKMLPEKIKWNTESWPRLTMVCQDVRNNDPVLDTELLHLCWLVEEELKEEEEQETYIHKLYQMQSLKNKAKWKIHFDCHATWRQRVKALVKVKEIKI
jgi:hypothetical protein